MTLRSGLPTPRGRLRRLLLLAFSFAILAGVSGSLCAQDVIKGGNKKIKIEWGKTKTEHFVIRYEKVLADGQSLGRVKKELEDIYDQYKKLFKFAPEELLRVKMLDNLNTYAQEGGKPSMGGFYSPAGRFLVLRMDLPYYNLIPTVYHEALHQYLHAYVGDVPIPLWFNEGVAVYYEGMQRDDNKGKTLNPKKILKRRLRMVKARIRTRTAIPLAELVDADHDAFHEKERESLHYAQSFSVIYFFMRATRGKAIIDYMTTLRDTKDPEAANAKLFGKGRKKLRSVEKKWMQFTLGVDHESLTDR